MSIRMQDLQSQIDVLGQGNEKQNKTIKKLSKNSQNAVKRQNNFNKSFSKTQQAEVKLQEQHISGTQQAIEITNNVKLGFTAVQMAAMLGKLTCLTIAACCDPFSKPAWLSSAGICAGVEGKAAWCVTVSSLALAGMYGAEGNITGCLMSAGAACMSAISAMGAADSATTLASASTKAAEAAADTAAKLGVDATMEAVKGIGDEAVNMLEVASKEAIGTAGDIVTKDVLIGIGSGLMSAGGTISELDGKKKEKKAREEQNKLAQQNAPWIMKDSVVKQAQQLRQTQSSNQNVFMRKNLAK
jgi:hypothetical protein